MAHSEGGTAVHHEAPKGFIRKYVFSYDHKVIGIQYYFLALASALTGMSLSLFMRLRLDFLSAAQRRRRDSRTGARHGRNTLDYQPGDLLYRCIAGRVKFYRNHA